MSIRNLSAVATTLDTASEVLALPLPHGRSSVTDPRASASGHSQIVMTLCLAAAALTLGVAAQAQAPKRIALVGGMLLDGYEAPPIHNAAILIEGNKIVEATGSIQSADKKFSQTQVEVRTGSDGVNHITAIDLGGTNTKLTFNN